MTTQFRPEQADLTKYWDFGSGTMRVPSGTEFPGAPNDGDVFYRTDEDKLYIYDGVAWEGITLPTHDVVATHTLTGAQWDLVGATALDTIGLLTPSADVSAGAEAILKSTAAGDLALHDLTATGQLSAGAGIDEGLILGADAQWYRSAANMLRTPDSVTIDVGLNVGTATGATVAGKVYVETAIARVRILGTTRSELGMGDSGAGAGEQNFRLTVNAGALVIGSLSDDWSAWVVTDILNITHAGAVTVSSGLNVGTTLVQGTYAIRQVFSKTAIVDNTATGVFKVNTVAAGNQGGGYSCTVHALIGHSCGSTSSRSAAKSFIAHFAHVNDINGNPGISAVSEISESAVAADDVAVRDIGAVTMTAVPNGNDEVQVKFTIDLTGTGVSSAVVNCQVELAWHGYITAPTMTVM